MTTPPILVLKKGTATQFDIKTLRKAGVAVIEVLDPADVRYMDPPLATVSGIEALCFRMVDEVHRSESVFAQIDKEKVRQKIAQYVMADCRGKQPQAAQK